MAILISSPKSGSLKVQNTAASPQSSYLTNLSTCIVAGDYSANQVTITNNDNQLLAGFPLSQISTISASVQSFGMQWAVDSIATLIMV